MELDRIVTPMPEELQKLFNLEGGTQPKSNDEGAQEAKTLAEPEAWVRDFLSDLEDPPIETICKVTGTPINDVQRAVAVSKKQAEMLFGVLPAAIRALRRKLGKSQWEMSFKLGFQHGCIARWESGRGTPSGVAMLMLLRMCPDDESLANFGLPFILSHGKPSRSGGER